MQFGRPYHRFWFIIFLMLASGYSRAEPALEAEAPAFTRSGPDFIIPEGSPLRARLLIAVVQPASMPHQLSFPALVEADPAGTAVIFPPLAARLIAVKAGLGDSVKRGDPLAILVSGDYAQYWSDVEKSRDGLALAQKSLDRARAVGQAGGAAEKDLETALSTYVQARSENDRAKAALAAHVAELGPAGTGMPPLTLTAPLSGSITQISAAAGSYLNDPTQGFMTITNLDSVFVTVSLPEIYLGLVQRGMTVAVTLTAMPDETRTGQVASIDPNLDPDTRRGRVRIRFANPDQRLKPNMFATARFTLPQRAGVLAPQSALVMKNDSVTVLVETAPWRFQRRAVELGSDEGDATRIISGLRLGEHIIVKGAVLLNDE